MSKHTGGYDLTLSEQLSNALTITAAVLVLQDECCFCSNVVSMLDIEITNSLAMHPNSTPEVKQAISEPVEAAEESRVNKQQSQKVWMEMEINRKMETEQTQLSGRKHELVESEWRRSMAEGRNF